MSRLYTETLTATNGFWTNIRIEVAFDNVWKETRSGWEVDPDWPVVIENGGVKNKRIEIGAGHKTTSGAGRTTQQILTRDGGEARL